MTQRTIYLLRHAKSDWGDPNLEDHERPLAPRGERDARRMAKYMRREKIKPDMVLCSPAKRARQTLELLAPGFGKKTKTRVEDDLYGASEQDLLQRLSKLPNEVGSVMLIGHNPAMQELALGLAATGSDLERLQANLATCGLATLSIKAAGWSDVQPGSALLTALVTPKDL